MVAYADLLNRYREEGRENMAKRKKRLGLVVERVVCDYGCGGLAYYRFVNGKVCCSESCRLCPAVRKKLSITKGGTGILREEVPAQLCECECGELANPGCRFIDGHQRKGVKGYKTKKSVRIENSEQVCFYCGQKAYYRFRNGKWCCQIYMGKCPAVRKERSISHGGTGEIAVEQLCTCGCGQKTTLGCSYVKGHNLRGKKELAKSLQPRKIEESGKTCFWCGGEAFYKLGTHYLCSSNLSKCPARIKEFTAFVDKVNNDSDFAEMKEKRVKGIRRSRTSEFKKKQREIMTSWNKDHPEAGEEHSEWLIEHCEDPEVIKQMSEVMIKAHQEHSESFKESRRKTTKKARRPEARKKASEKTKQWNKEHPEELEKLLRGLINSGRDGYGKSGYYFSNKNNKDLHYRSSYELIAYQILEQIPLVEKYEVEPVVVYYEFQGDRKRTYPDILVTYTDGSKSLIEVKSEHMMKDKQTNAKFWAVNDYAVEHGWEFEVWTKKELDIMEEQTNGL